MRRPVTQSVPGWLRHVDSDRGDHRVQRDADVMAFASVIVLLECSEFRCAIEVDFVAGGVRFRHDARLAEDDGSVPAGLPV